MKLSGDIKDHMVSRPHTIDARATIVDAIMKMHKYDVRHLPVLSNGECVGVISDRDIAEAWNRRPLHFPIVEEAMTRDPYTVSLDAKLAGVLQAMVARKVDCVIVLAADHGVAGIFTGTDAEFLLSQLVMENERSVS